MGMGFAPTWLRQVSPPLLHKTTLTTAHTATIAPCALRNAPWMLRKSQKMQSFATRHSYHHWLQSLSII